jgi:uncharacterized protein YceK
MNATRQIIRVMTCVLGMVGLQGCGTIAAHIPPPKGQPLPATSNGHYRGVRWDIGLLNTGLYMTDPGGENLEGLFLPLYLADLPLSGVADTILLPFDRVHSPVTNTPPNTALEPTATAP